MGRGQISEGVPRFSQGLREKAFHAPGHEMPLHNKYRAAVPPFLGRASTRKRTDDEHNCSNPGPQTKDGSYESEVLKSGGRQ